MEGQGSKARLRVPALDEGMVSAFPITIVPQEEGYTRKLFNMDFDEVQGLIRKRPGLKKRQSFGSTINGLWEYKEPESQEIYIIVGQGSELVYISEFGESTTTLKSGLDSEGFFDFTELGGQLLIVNGKDDSMVWDGSSLDEPEEFPKGKYLTEFRFRAVTAGMQDDPLVLRVSHPGDPTMWDPGEEGSRAFEVYTGDSQPITGLAQLDDFVLIGKERSLHALTGTTTEDFAVFPLDRNIGLGSHWAARVMRNVVYFPDKYGGIYRLESGAMPEKISTPVKDYIDKVDWPNIHKATAVIFQRHQYVLSLPHKDGGYMTLAYDTVRDRWRSWDTHMKVSALLHHEQEGTFHFVKPSEEGSVYQLETDSVNDGGEPIESELETIEYHMGAPEQEKEINNLYLGIWCTKEPTDLTVYYSLDKSDWEWVANESIAGNKGDYKKIRIPIGKSCRSIQFKIENKSKDQNLRILDMVITFLPRELE